MHTTTRPGMSHLLNIVKLIDNKPKIWKPIFILLKIKENSKNKNCWKLINQIVRLTCWGIYEFVVNCYYYLLLFSIISNYNYEKYGKFK